MRGICSYLLVFIAALCLCLPSHAQETRHGRGDFPRVFDPEDYDKGFEQAQPPSDLVLNALLDTEEARGYTPELQGKSHEDLRGLFRVVEIRLGPAREHDYIALGKGPLIGADCYWFWIVRVQSGNAKVLLFVNTLKVTILRATTNGYSDIRGDWGAGMLTGTTKYKFDGSSYKLIRSKTWEHKH